MNDQIQTFTVFALPILFAITLHEAAHAYAAKFFGDTTAYAQGRMSLNPVRHIDPVGTLLIPIVLYMVSSPFLFGYAKPVPIDFSRLRNPKRDMAWVALAGPAANLVMAVCWKVFGMVLLGMHVDGLAGEFFQSMAEAGVFTNIVILAFNLFPVPPLDGGRIMTSMLPMKYALPFARLEPYGFFIVLALAFTNMLSVWMQPVMMIASLLVQVLVFPLNFLVS